MTKYNADDHDADDGENIWTNGRRFRFWEASKPTYAD